MRRRRPLPEFFEFKYRGKLRRVPLPQPQAAHVVPPGAKTHLLHYQEPNKTLCGRDADPHKELQFHVTAKLRENDCRACEKICKRWHAEAYYA